MNDHLGATFVTYDFEVWILLDSPSLETLAQHVLESFPKQHLQLTRATEAKRATHTAITNSLTAAD